MKQQVSRLSPHQNGKVAAVLLTAISLVFVLPFALVAKAFGPPGGPSVFLLLLFPVLYLIVGYLSTAFWCWFYNLMVRFVGGFEFESRSEAS